MLLLYHTNVTMIYPMDRKLAPDDGLNVVEYNNAPEVVHLGHDMPEVAPRGKFASPFHEKVVVQYDVAPALAHSEYGDPSRNYMINQPIQTGGRQRRICGIKRPIFLLLAVILILLITAAVLGGVLSAVLGKKNVSAQAQVSNSTSSTLPSNASNTTTSNPATEAMDMTGLALLSPPGSSTMYAYYANKLGVIVEATLPQSPGSSSKPFDLSNSAIANVSTNALPGSSIAAVSYVQNGNTIRQIFYFGSAGLLTMASGSDGKWSSSWSTVASTTQPYRSNAALSAVADTHALQGIRVYFASQRGVIQECGVYFVENIWRDGQYFVGSDPTAGVASAITNNINHVYMRNISSVLQQWTFNYTADVAQPGQPWKIGKDPQRWPPTKHSH